MVKKKTGFNELLTSVSRKPTAVPLLAGLWPISTYIITPPCMISVGSFYVCPCIFSVLIYLCSFLFSLLISGLITVFQTI